MKRISGVIVEGEKIGFEKVQGRDNKQFYVVHILAGFESMKLTIRDSKLAGEIEAIPNRKAVKVKVEVATYKDELYLQALAIVV